MFWDNNSTGASQREVFFRNSGETFVVEAPPSHFLLLLVSLLLGLGHWFTAVHSPSPAFVTCIMTCHGCAGIVLMLRLLLLFLWVVGGFEGNFGLSFFWNMFGDVSSLIQKMLDGSGEMLLFSPQTVHS